MKLKLNPEKTEFIVISDRQTRESLMQKFYFPPTDIVKNLGVTFDSGNTFTSRTTKVCLACYYHLNDLRHIRKFLNPVTAALLANSMISSQLDYCNSLLYGVSKYNVVKRKKFKMPFVELFLDLIEQAMSLPFFKNYTGSTFHTTSCLNII